MRKITLPLILALGLLLPCVANTALAASVPSAADSIGKQLDKQMVQRYAAKTTDDGLSQSERENRMRARTIIMGTVAADLNDLNASCPLARQMTEEISRYLVSKGYRFQELRKGSYIRFHPETGELILTRNVRQLASRVGTSHAVLAGTYVVSADNVRFTMRLIHTTTNEVLAMGTATVSISDDVLPLLYDFNSSSRSNLLTGTGSGLQ